PSSGEDFAGDRLLAELDPFELRVEGFRCPGGDERGGDDEGRGIELETAFGDGFTDFQKTVNLGTGITYQGFYPGGRSILVNDIHPDNRAGVIGVSRHQDELIAGKRPWLLEGLPASALPLVTGLRID